MTTEREVIVTNGNGGGGGMGTGVILGIIIAILVIARKVILLDFKTATLETFAGIGAIALAFGALYWLIGARGTAEKSEER